MGSSASKAARGSAARKYPTRSPGAAVSQAASRAKPEANPRGDGSKNDAILADSMDPDYAPGGFAQRLHQMGIAEPNPTYSPSSTVGSQSFPDSQSAPAAPIFPPARNNATLSVLEARRQLQERADEDLEAMGRASSPGRRFLDMRTLVDALELVRNGASPADVERRFMLAPRLLSKLGRPGVLSHASTSNLSESNQ